jgi:tRNA threonylcarbamoyladenosine biosynthesis protein TsaE
LNETGRTVDGEHQLFSRSPEETLFLGKGLGQVLQTGHFVGLVGELGSGKTQFVRGVAEGAEVPALEVASPTFAILYPYRGRIPLYHADLFRVTGYEDLYATGFMELQTTGTGAVLVEWLNLVPQATPPELLLLSFDYGQGENERVIRAKALGKTHATLLSEWVQLAVGRR